MRNTWNELLPEDAFKFEGKRSIKLWGSSPSPPPAPDYTGAAQATGASNLAAQQSANAANHPNMYTPLGNQTYSYDPSTQQFTGNISLSPEQQGLYNQSVQNQAKVGSLANQQLNALQAPTALDTSGLPTAPNVGNFSYQGLSNPMNGQTAQDAIMSRLAPQMQVQQTSMDNQLANQGIMQGSQAWTNAQRELGYQQNDARQQAALQGIAVDQQNNQLQAGNQLNAYNANLQGAQAQNAMNMGQYQQGLASQITAQNQPLAYYNALQTGAQPSMPSFQGTAAAQSAGGTNYSGATAAQGQWDTGIYNAQAQQSANNTNAIAGLGSAAVMAAMMY